jgi:hypothetical protein
MKKKTNKLVSNNKIQPLYYSIYETGDISNYRKTIKNVKIKEDK